MMKFDSPVEIDYEKYETQANTIKKEIKEVTELIDLINKENFESFPDEEEKDELPKGSLPKDRKAQLLQDLKAKQDYINSRLSQAEALKEETKTDVRLQKVLNIAKNNMLDDIQRNENLAKLITNC